MEKHGAHHQKRNLSTVEQERIWITNIGEDRMKNWNGLDTRELEVVTFNNSKKLNNGETVSYYTPEHGSWKIKKVNNVTNYREGLILTDREGKEHYARYVVANVNPFNGAIRYKWVYTLGPKTEWVF